MARLAALLAATMLIAPASALADEAEPDPRPPYFSSKNVEAPPPWFYAEPTFALGWFPGILVAFSPFQVRFPLHRSEGIAFQNTYAGVGGWTRISPSLIEFGGRFDLAPIDVFDLAVWVKYSHSFPTFAGRLPYSEFTDKTFASRRERTDAIESNAFEVVLEPTLKIQAGPLIALYRASIQFTRLFLDEPTDAPWVYDAGRDLAVLPEGGALIEQSVVIAADVLGHTPSPITLRLGYMLRHRRVLTAGGDRMLNMGFIGMFKPGRRPAAPTMIMQVLAYVIDEDRVLAGPQILLGFQWAIEAVPTDKLLPRFHGL